jgi:hypothetical protein
VGGAVTQRLEFHWKSKIEPKLACAANECQGAAPRRVAEC